MERSLAPPPSPFSLPLIGHFHLLKEPVHHSLHTLSTKYGTVFGLQLGSRPAVVVSSPSAVEECFTKNDAIFANRPRISLGEHLQYDNTAMASAPYGPHWRNLRRITNTELFTPAQLNAYSHVREDETRSLMKELFRECDVGGGFRTVELNSSLRDLTFNVTMRMVSGKRYEGLKEAFKLQKTMEEIMELNESFYIGDYFPFLQWIDFQGMKKRLRRLKAESDGFSQDLLDEHRRKLDGFCNSSSMIDAMLSLQELEPHNYSDEIIKGIILTLLLGGTDTTATTIGSAILLLLHHPRILQKARIEIDGHISSNRLIQETDLPKLKYLQNIVNETLRLFPVAPLLLPHESSKDCIVGGYNIPSRTLLLVNAWAIHRDPQLWDDPISFRPERFEIWGREAYHFIPFGMGRRQCPGVGLANRELGMVLGSFIQCFEWDMVRGERMDLSEIKGSIVSRDVPLEAKFKTRKSMINVLSRL